MDSRQGPGLLDKEAGALLVRVLSAEEVRDHLGVELDETGDQFGITEDFQKVDHPADPVLAWVRNHSAKWFWKRCSARAAAPPSSFP